MISRLKAPVLSCLHPPPPPSGAERRMRVSQRNGGIPGCAAETAQAPFCLIDYLRKREGRLILRKHLSVAFPLSLSFASQVWSSGMMDEGLALWPLMSSPLPLSLSSSSSSSRHTRTLRHTVLAGDGWGAGSVAVIADTQSYAATYSFVSVFTSLFLYLSLH